MALDKDVRGWIMAGVSGMGRSLYSPNSPFEVVLTLVSLRPRIQRHLRRSCHPITSWEGGFQYPE